MGSELAVTASQTVGADIAWANRLAKSELMPGQYRNRPANLLWAAEYAKSLNLHPMTAVTGIFVIDGKPSASGALISALVRRAGHKLRVVTKTDRATAYITRHDDPDFTFEVTWELKANKNGNPNAQDAGLLTKDVWRKYTAAMLGWRAITDCARIACEEALLGVHYTPEELGVNVNQDGIPIRAEQMKQVSFEDMLAEQIEAATNMDTLSKLHRDAILGGILEAVPTQSMEQGRVTRTILVILNEKAKEITAAEKAGRGEEDNDDGSTVGMEDNEAEDQAAGQPTVIEGEVIETTEYTDATEDKP